MYGIEAAIHHLLLKIDREVTTERVERILSGCVALTTINLKCLRQSKNHLKSSEGKKDTRHREKEGLVTLKPIDELFKEMPAHVNV